MKKVIGGRLYNTETATELGSASYGNRGDLHGWEETLYRTPRGAYFVVFSGGALSRYGRSCGPNTCCADEGIRTLAEADALEWAEVNGLDADAIVVHFEIEEA